MYFILRTPDIPLRIWRHNFVKSAEVTHMIHQGQTEVNVSGIIIYSVETKIRKRSEKNSTIPQVGGGKISSLKNVIS